MAAARAIRGWTETGQEEDEDADEEKDDDKEGKEEDPTLGAATTSVVAGTQEGGVERGLGGGKENVDVDEKEEEQKVDADEGEIADEAREAVFDEDDKEDTEE